MKLNNILLAGCFAITALCACVSENQDLESINNVTGNMALNVSQIEPMVTRALTEVTNYPVYVKNSEGKIVKQWDAVSAVPSKVAFSVGSYVVESHTPGTCEDQMATPYYQGTFDMEIIEGQTTDVDVVCKMLNSKIQVIYEPEFLEFFTSWTITITDSKKKAIDFTNAKGTAPAPVYWLLSEKTDTLTLDFRGTTNQGKSVTDRKFLTKELSTLKYEDDSDFFTGGDALEITIKPAPESIITGKVEHIIINADIVFSQDGKPHSIEVTDSDSGSNTGGGEGNDPGNDDEAITLNMPPDMTVTDETDPKLGDAVILTPNGIKSLIVTIESTNDEMIESLQGVADEYEGVDFINGAEVVGNTNLVEFLGELGQDITVPETGATEYTFPIGNFFGFLMMLDGTHTFHMTVEDLKGNKKQGTINLTI